MPPLKFLERIRKASRPGTWSLGVNMARADAVAVDSRSDDEIVLRVKAPGRTVAPTVVLYPGEGEWDCDCGSRVSPCEHIAAAAIVLGQTDGSARPAPVAATQWGHVVYRFARAGEGLRLRRVIVHGNGTEEPIASTLSALLSNPATAARLQPEKADLHADLLLDNRAHGVLPPDKLLLLLEVLMGSRQVFLDGRPVAVSDEKIFPRALVEDAGDQVVLIIGRDPRVTEVVSAGTALAGEALHPLGELPLAGAFWQHLPVAHTYGPQQIGEIATKILPELTKRMTVDVRSRRLPQVVRDLQPRVVLDLQRVGAALSVFPTLVYGSPPCVRIDDGKMVYLRGPVPVRDEASERRLVQNLRDELNLMPGRRANFDGADTAQFASRLKRWRGALVGDAAGVVGSKLRLEPRLRLDPGGTTAAGVPAIHFDLEFALTGEGEGKERTLDAETVMRAWQDGLGLVPLDGGGWAPLPQAWLDEHGQRVADLLAAREADGRVATHALPMLGTLCQELERPPPPGLDRLAPLLEGFERLPETALPPDLTAALRPYQRQGTSWLAFLKSTGMGGVLADDMGLGKTVQALSVLGSGTLVVCPTSVLPNWEAEIRRFRPTLRVCAYHGTGRRLENTADITLTTYALLRLDGEALVARTWDAVVLDEAQAIKNPDSQVARAAFALKAQFRLALTGTPLENRLEELWSLLHFTNRGLLGGRRDFDDRYARPIAAGDRDASAQLRQRIRPFVLRRLKKDVAPELPPRTEAVLTVALDERERAVYDAVRAAAQAEMVSLLNQGDKGNVLKALEALLRLRQAACHPALVPGQGAEARTSSKIVALLEALETAAADGHKALVFSQWTSLLDLVEPPLRAAGVGFTRLDGATRDRGEVVERFQTPDGPPVMLVSLKAGGSGLNLTAADHVFLLDPWWNPAVEAQAADRAHRIGQERPVFVYRLVAQNTVEERILGLQAHKRALFDTALEDAHAAATLTRDDLLALLQ